MRIIAKIALLSFLFLSFSYAQDANETKIKGIPCKMFFQLKNKIPDNRPIILFVWEKGCPYCMKELQLLRHDDVFKNIVATKYLLVYCEKNDKLLPPPFSTTDLVPSFFIVDKNFKHIAYPAKGVIPPKKLDNWLEAVYNAYQGFLKGAARKPSR